MRRQELTGLLPFTDNVVWVKMGGTGLSHSASLCNFQKAIDLSKDDLLGDILQDLNTEVSESLGVVRYSGDTLKK